MCFFMNPNVHRSKITHALLNNWDAAFYKYAPKTRQTSYVIRLHKIKINHFVFLPRLVWKCLHRWTRVTSNAWNSITKLVERRARPCTSASPSAVVVRRFFLSRMQPTGRVLTIWASLASSNSQFMLSLISQAIKLNTKNNHYRNTRGTLIIT